MARSFLEFPIEKKNKKNKVSMHRVVEVVVSSHQESSAFFLKIISQRNRHQCVALVLAGSLSLLFSN